MRRNILPLLIALVTLVGFGVQVRADEAQTKAGIDRVKDAKLKEHLMTNIDIFGQTDLPAIYILAPGVDGDEEIKGSIITRDFSRDEFFMQNIDREEFELKVTLREFNGDDDEKKKEEARR